jgi:hypothetical protein
MVAPGCSPPTRVRHLLPGQQLKQRRLAGAVPPDERDAFARFNLQHDIVKQREMPERERDMVEGGDGHLGSWCRDLSTPQNPQSSPRR